MTHGFYPVQAPGGAGLCLMPRPRGGDQLDAELAALRQAGVDVLVCLLPSAERDALDLSDEPVAAARAGLEFHQLPIPDFGVPQRADAGPVLDLLTARLREGRRVVVHCRGGIGRSGLVAAALLVRLGVPLADAWDHVSAARGHRVPETDEQRAWLQRAVADDSWWPA